MFQENKLLILVCDGDEFKAVNKGFVNKNNNINIQPLPIGIEPVNKLFNNKKYSGEKILLIGLGGSLSSDYKVGDILIYESCGYFLKGKFIQKNCDRSLNNVLKSKFNTPLVKGLTTDKLIASPQDKSQLNQESNCTVVDMESYAVMNHFESVAVVRIISDNFDEFLPDLNSAITLEKKLDKLKMTIAFIKEPLKAIKLIKNALISLNKLEEISKQISELMENGEWRMEN